MNDVKMETRLARIETKIDMLLDWRTEHRAHHAQEKTARSRLTIGVFLLLLGTVAGLVV